MTLFKMISGFILSTVLVSCSGTPPLNIGLSEAKLTACPSSPNCVSSDGDDQHKVLPFQLKMSADKAWDATVEIVANQTNTTIIKKTVHYLHVEYKTSFWGFVDDLELHLRPAEHIIAIRSASRLGYSDFDANRNRVSLLRTVLQIKGIIK